MSFGKKASNSNKRQLSNSRTMSDPSLTLFGAGYSVYTRIARLALHEKGVAYRFEPIDIFAEDGPPDDYLKRHPFGRIPAFEHEGFCLYEAAAIARYVDEGFAGPKLQPVDARARARMSQIISILDSYGFRSLVWDVFVERVRAPQKGGQSDEARIEAGLATARICLSALCDIRGNDIWLVGAEVSLADLHAYPMLTLFRLAPEGLALFETYPALVKWYKALGNRESVRATRHPMESEEVE